MAKIMTNVMISTKNRTQKGHILSIDN